jgi:hypothetical protein
MLGMIALRLRQRAYDAVPEVAFPFSRGEIGPWNGLARERVASATRSFVMIRKLSSGQYRLYSRKVDPKTGKRRNLGTFKSRTAAEKHEREVQYFKRH